MANVKVPALLHKMSVSSQKAWYKQNKMELPAHLAGGEGKSAAQAKKDVGEINKARAAAIAKAAASEKNKKLVSSSERVRQAAANARAFGGSRLGGDLTSAGGMVRHILSGGTLKVAEESDYSNLPRSEAARRRMDDKIKQAYSDQVERAEKAIERYKKGQVPANDIKEAAEQVDEANQQNKAKKKEFVRQVGLKAMAAGKVDPARGHIPQRAGREELRKEETEKSAGGQMSLAQKLAKQAMSLQKKTPGADVPADKQIAQQMGEDTIGEHYNEHEYDHEGEMAKTQLRGMMMHAKKLHDMLDDDTNLPEWVQSKITLAADYMQTAADYVDSEQDEDLDEETQIDEKYMGFKALKASIEARGGARDAGAVAAAIGRKKYGKAAFQKAAAKGEKLGEEESKGYSGSPAEIKAKYYHDLAQEKKAKKEADAKEKSVKEALDPVGHEDSDVNNDGKVDKNDKYLLNRRAAVAKAIKDKMAKKLGK